MKKNLHSTKSFSTKIASITNVRLVLQKYILLLVFSLASVSMWGQITSTGTGGDFNTGSTWVGGIAPTSSDNVVIVTGAVVSTGNNLTRTGTTTVNGSFQLNNGGYASGTNFTYGSAGTLIFNNSSGSYGINNTDAYWPIANGPVNVSLINAGGITLNGTRTVTGNFKTTGPVSLPSSLTVLGTVTINPNGSFVNSPIYGTSSTLVYNTGGSYN